MKNVADLLIIVNDICPNIKSSESLFIVDLIITEQAKAYEEGANRALELSSPDYSAIKEEYADFYEDEERRQEAKEEKEHYADYSDQ